MKINYNLTFKKLEVKDLRFPTSLNSDGADAMHCNPDYSCAYVSLFVEDEKSKKMHELVGNGLTFTLGMIS